jgi:hypothetical protein
MLKARLQEATSSSTNRRRVPRYAFGGVAEICPLHSHKYIIASTTELSCLGCFIRTSASLPAGTQVTLKITHDESEFTANGKVAYVLAARGMGIEFEAIEPKDEALLETWLKQATP